MDYENEWEWPYTDGYTGMYYSDGKIQASVANGQYRPRSKLAALSREHDTSYNLCDSNACLDRADRDYFDATRNMSFVPRFIGALPKKIMPKIRAFGRLVGDKMDENAELNRLTTKLRGAFGAAELTNSELERYSLLSDRKKNYTNLRTVDNDQLLQQVSVPYLPDIKGDTVNAMFSKIQQSNPHPEVCSSELNTIYDFRSAPKAQTFMGGLFRKRRKRNKNKIYMC